MAKGPDAGLRKLVHDKLGKPVWRWHAIETGASAAGLPDGYGLHRPSGTVLWLECKKADHWAIKFEPFQLQFFELVGPHVRSFVGVRALGAAATGGAGDGLYLYPGSAVPALDAQGLRVEPLLKLLGPARSWDWAAVERTLLA